MTELEQTGQARTEPLPAIDWDHVRATGEMPMTVRALQIETSSACNFRCPSCPLSLEDYDRPEKYMTPEEFARVLDAWPTVRKIELQGLGEVFLNEHLLPILAEARRRGIEVHTFSNASKVDRALAFDVVRSGLALINFSMDGSDEATFRRLRKGGTLARYKRCVTNLVAARAALGSATPRIGIMSVLSKANAQQVPHMLAIAEELGVDTITFTKINVEPKPDQAPLELDGEDRGRLDALPGYRGKVQVVPAYAPWTKEQRMDCHWPRYMAYVTVEGHVTPCCNYFDERELSLGNVFEQSGEEIWNGEPYKRFRRELLNGHLPSKCETC